MNINIKLNKNFTTQYNKLQEEFGTEIAKINGFGDEQLSYTDFIDNFIDKDTVADSSVDGNSNVSHKDIVTLEREMSKPHEQLLAFNKIYYEMQKKFGFKDANEWLRKIWVGELYLHDACTSTLKSYCFAYDLKDLAEKGLYFIDGRNSQPAQHLMTFVDFVKEFVSYASNRTSGACGLPNLLPYMFYFWKKDVNEGYYLKNPEYYAKQSFQRFIYAVNQPYCRDSSQSAFTNTSVFDKPYFEALFGGSEFPDGTFMIDYEDEIMEFQKWYMEVMSQIRSECMFTFPVNTISLLRKDGKFVDEEFAKWAVRHNMTWSDSNIFCDSSVNSLSNCCFDGSQLTLSKSSNGVNFMTFKELYELPYKDTKRNFTIFQNGNWLKGKIVRLPRRPMYRIVTANNKELILTDNHISLTYDGEKRTTDLTVDDYLLFSTKSLNAVHEQDENLTYNQGFLIGMYLGDGSMQNENTASTTTVHLSLNETKYESSIELIKDAIDNKTSIKLGTPYNNVYPVRITDNATAIFIRKYVSGKYCFEKRLNMNCLLQSVDFRKGILDGYYLTDGGNNNRIYTTSEDLVKDIECLCTSLGLTTVIDVTDRTGVEEVEIRDKFYNRNFPVWCIRWYETYRRFQKDIYKWRNNSIYYKIKLIEPYETDDKYCYCFEMENDEEPYFTLPNGIITHNCRLKSDIRELGYFNSIGGTALKVGSVKVSTINLARIALDTNSEEEYLEELKKRTWINLKSLDCVRHIIKRNVEKGLLPNFSYGLINFEYLYNTNGFIGIYETMKKFGYTKIDEIGNTYYTEEASKLGQKIFEVMRSVADEFKEKYNCDYQINTEQIPGETAASKLMKKDKFFYPEADIYDLPLYGNQFIPLGIKATGQERIRVASEFDSYCSGGSIVHYNIDAPFDSFEKAWKMVNYIADQGVTYFAFNTKIQACEDNHAFYGSSCPVCGKPVATEYTRIVGFYTPVKSYSEERKKEFKLREWHDVN